ncbi:MAG: LPXTG cell wall anchor domain-containing protein [Parasphingopyxis sp.]|nr:LPXTG cell wall anchor domain-containing protein [Sphingomonadales bacterium]
MGGIAAWGVLAGIVALSFISVSLSFLGKGRPFFLSMLLLLAAVAFVGGFQSPGRNMLGNLFISTFWMILVGVTSAIAGVAGYYLRNKRKKT